MAHFWKKLINQSFLHLHSAWNTKMLSPQLFLSESLSYKDRNSQSTGQTATHSHVTACILIILQLELDPICWVHSHRSKQVKCKYKCVHMWVWFFTVPSPGILSQAFFWCQKMKAFCDVKKKTLSFSDLMYWNILECVFLRWVGVGGLVSLNLSKTSKEMLYFMWATEGKS